MQPSGPTKTSLVEIGPRFVLTPIRIFEGAFGGATVFSNPGILLPHLRCISRLSVLPEFISPAAVRSALKRKAGDKYKKRKNAQTESRLRADKRRLEEDDLAVAKIFA